MTRAKRNGIFTVYNKCIRTNYINKNRQKIKKKRENIAFVQKKNGTVKHIISQAGSK